MVMWLTNPLPEDDWSLYMYAIVQMEASLYEKNAKIFKFRVFISDKQICSNISLYNK